MIEGSSIQFVYSVFAISVFSSRFMVKRNLYLDKDAWKWYLDKMRQEYEFICK